MLIEKETHQTYDSGVDKTGMSLKTTTARTRWILGWQAVIALAAVAWLVGVIVLLIQSR